MGYQFHTRCLYGNGPDGHTVENTGSLNIPIYQTATFAHPGVGKSTGYDYTRAQNPTRERLEEVTASLEEGKTAIAFSSGMAALTAVLELFSPGSHIIASEDLYGGTIRLFHTISAKNQVLVSYYDTSDARGLEALIRPETRAIYIETPSNPLMKVTDIREISRIAEAHDLLLIVDNTFLSPYYQKPLKLGAHIVIHSGTKFLGGHNDTLAGLVITGDKETGEKIRFIRMTTGAALSPFDSWLILRGIKTLPLRMDRAQENALQTVQFLKAHPKVTEVYFVGEPEHPGYSLNKSQATGFGSMISFRVDRKETAVSLLEGIRMIQYAESLGGVETLLTYPALQTHADVPEETRNRLGITDTFLRMSVGVEDVKDIIADLEQALAAHI